MMASGQYGTPIIVQYGNATSMTNPPGPPVIDSRVFTNLSATLAPPSFASPKMLLIERVTPRSMNAQRTIQNNLARARIALRSGRGRVFDTIGGYGASAGLKQPIERLQKIVRSGSTTTTATRIK
jgi:hypothetical protein